MGGHFMFDDDQQTPNTLNATFAFEEPQGKRKMMELEIRHWITNHEAVEIGTNAYGANGIPPAGLTKKPEDKQVLGPERRQNQHHREHLLRIKRLPRQSMAMMPCKTWLTDQVEPGPFGKASGDHWANFIDCVRSRRAENLHCPIEEGHISSTLVHLANTSYRLGRTLKFDPEREQVIADEEATKMLHGTYRAPYVVPEAIV